MSDKNTFKSITFSPKGKNYIQYGFRYIQGNSEPYFSITAHSENLVGCHDEIIKKIMPKLEPLTQFHLWGQNTMLPMYYVENAIYFFEQWKGNQHRYDEKTKEQALEQFKNHVLLQENESIPENIGTEIYDFLNNRKEMIQKLFNQTMDKFEIERIKM